MKGTTMKGKPHKRVSLRGSALFKLTSPVRLAQILCIPPAQLDRLLRRGNTNYCVRTDRKTERLIENGRASCRERVCQYVEISEVSVSLKKKNKQKNINRDQ